MSETESTSEQPEAAETSTEGEQHEARVDARLARLEAQLEGLSERVLEIGALQARARQQALYTRIFLMLVLLGAFFFIRSRAG